MKPGIGTAALSLATLFGTAALPLFPAAGQAVPATTSPSTFAAKDDACSGLARLKLKDVTITVATSIAEGEAVPNAGLMPMFGKAPTVAKGLPAFCRVAGHIRPEAGSDIGFEVWLPNKDRANKDRANKDGAGKGWDGRLHGIGIGGFAGGIDYFTLGLALKGGQAGVATDTGHSGTMMESGWAKGNPQRVRDYGWRAVHLSTVTAKRLVSAFYGRGPDKSYFVGCSGGGRQGLMEAARYPKDYDGILSGAPAANFTNLAMAMINPIQAQLSAQAVIRPEQVKLLQTEVIRQCDGADGQPDGLVADPRQCRFDVAKLACGTADAAVCFSPPQIAALQRIHTGPRDSSGRQLAGGYLPSGAEAGAPSPQLGWEGYVLGGNRKSGGQMLADGILGDLIQRPFATSASFDWDKDPARLRAVAADLDAPADLRRFFARGGKLILWHGWADAAIPPEATLDYHDTMLRASGARAKDSVRLFMVPGVQHCTGGTGPDSFGQNGAPKPSDAPERNMVAALQSWVEGSRAAPETLIGRRGHGGMMGLPEASPERQRLLCAAPKTAVLQPGGDPDLAANYSCK